MSSSLSAVPAVLSIGGSDCCGAAGIQADIKTFAAFGVYGATAVTCMIAQQPGGGDEIRNVDPEFVVRQIRAACETFPVAAVKTGILQSAEMVRAVAAAIVAQGIPVLVVDPVMFSSSGARVMSDDAIGILRAELLPQARVVTPNVREAEILAGRSISNTDDLRLAAREICERFDVACIAMGGGLVGDEILDVLYDENEEFIMRSPRILSDETHGIGCTFSAALTSCLAHGMHLSEALARTKDFVGRALREAVMIGHHRPLNWMWASESDE